MTHSINKDIDKELRTLILNTANNNHAPILGTVSDISDDGRFIDVNLQMGGTLPSVKLFSGEPDIGKEVLLIFVEGDVNEPRAFVEDYTVKVPPYNLLVNGHFARFENNQFFNWSGGSLSDVSLYGDVGCELQPGDTLMSDYIDISSLINEEAFTLSFIWKNEGFSVEVLNQNDELITALPSVLGTKQQMSYVEDWSFQRYNYQVRGNTFIKIKFTNTSSKSSYIDGVRVWKPDDYQEWFPHKNDTSV